MAIVSPFNSVAGFSVGDVPANVILANGDIITGNLQANANVTVTGNITASYLVGNGSQLTGVTSNTTQNGNSNVQVYANANVTISSAGNANVFVVTGTGANISGTLSVSGNTIVGNLSTAGNVNSANLVTTGLITSVGNANVGNLNTAGLITATGNITGNNLITAGVVSAIGNVTGNYFIGNGSQLTGLNASGLSNGTSNVNIPLVNGNVNIVSAGNTTLVVTGTGANISGTLSASGNSNVGNLGTSGLITSTGNITGGNLTTGGDISAGGNITTGGLITSTGNITGGNISTAGVVSATGNITGGNLTTSGLITSTGNITGGNLTTGGLITSTGNLNAGNIITAGIMSSTGNATHGNIITGGTITSTGNANVGNLNSAGLVYANNNIIVGSTTTEGGQIVIGWVGVNNISSQSNSTWNMDSDASNNFRLFSLSASNVPAFPLIAYSSNNDTLIGNNLSVTGGATATTLSATGNVTGGNLITAGVVSATGNVTGNYFIGNGSQLTGIVASAGNSISNGTSNVDIATSGGNVTTSVGGTLNVVVVTATGANITGTLSASGNVTGENLIANTLTSTRVPYVGTNKQLTDTTNLVWDNPNQVLKVGAGGTEIGGDSGFGYLSTTRITAGGNANIGNIGTGGLITSTGNITGGNLTTGGIVSATGNITGNFFIGNGSQLTGIATGSGNSISNGTSNVSIATSGGNVTTVVSGNTTMTVTGTGANISGYANISGNSNVGNLGTERVIATGNISGTQLISNISTGTSPLVVTSTTQVANLNVETAGVAGTVTTASQPNITSVGTLTTLSVSGNATVGNLVTGGSSGNISGANVITANLFTGTLTTNSQPNITSVGTLTTLSVSGNSNVGNIGTTGIGLFGQVQIGGNLSYSDTANLIVVENKDAFGQLLAQNKNPGGNASMNIVVLNDLPGTSYMAMGVNSSNFTPFYNTLFEIPNAGYVSHTTNQILGSQSSDSANSSTFLTYNSGAGALQLNPNGAIGWGASYNGTLTQGNFGNVGQVLTSNGSNAPPQWTTISGGSGSNISNGTSNVNIATSNGNVTTSVGGNANVVVVTATGANITGTLSVSGNGTFGNINTTGSDGNISGANIISANTFTASGNIIAVGNITGSNLITGGVVSAIGNVTGNYFIGNGSQLTGIATGSSSNISNGTSNVNIATSNGNVTTSVGGNANVVVVTGTGANITGTLSASGNVAGDNLIANTLTSTRVPYVGTNKQLLDTTSLVWDNPNQVLKVGAGGTEIGGDAGFGYLNTKNVTATGNANIGNIGTSGLITSTGNITGGNLVTTNAVSAGTLTVSGNSNLGNVGNVKITGGTSDYVLKTDGAGNLSWAAQTGAVYFQSNVDSIVAGSALTVSVSYANATYPGGLFTLEQLGPVGFTATDTWVVTSATSKNAYANLIANTANVSNISLVLSLSNATFNVQSTDTITIGSSTITGANITGLGISGTGGTYTIANTLVAAAIQTNSSSAVSANLTTTRGVKTTSGTTLTTIAAVPFNVTALTGTFASSSVPYWTPTQTFNWSATLTSGATVISGNVTYSNSANGISGSLTSSGATSGTSTTLDSTLTYTISSTDYTGSGGNGAGTRTIPTTVNGTVSPATLYYPLFYTTTGSSANPNFTISSTRNSNNYATGQGANTTAITTNYLWIGTPTSTARSFGFTFLGSFVSVTPDVTYTNQTISGQTYTVYGFTNYSAVTFIYTV